MLSDILKKMINENLDTYEFWISRLEGNGALKRNRRHVKPQIVVVKFIGTNENIDFNDKYLDFTELNGKRYCFKYFSKQKMKPLSRETVIVSNLYNDEKKCKEGYNDSVYNQINILYEEKEKINREIDLKIETLKKSFIDSDYLIEKLSRN